jgi:hypothetical protein
MDLKLATLLTKKYSILVFFVLAQTVYLVMVLITLPYLREMAGGMEPFDMLPTGYDAAYAMNFMGSIGPEGRAFYLTRQIPLDLLYPGLFAISFSLIWLWLSAKIDKVPGIFKFCVFLPVYAGLADYIENGFIIAMLMSFPELPDSLVVTASAFTIIKSVATSLFFMALLSLAIMFGVQIFKHRKH